MSTTADKVRVVIADDERPARSFLASVLQKKCGRPEQLSSAVNINSLSDLAAAGNSAKGGLILTPCRLIRLFIVRSKCAGLGVPLHRELGSGKRGQVING